jgi:capsule polysaccharide export protein KpsE/RkpR
MFTYAKEYNKPTVMSYILKYTIGLPGVILGAIRKEKPDPVIAGESDDSTPKPLMLTKDEEKIIKVLAQNVNLAVDKKEGYLTLSVTGSEPLQTAELAIKAQQLLQEEITRFRTEKAQDNLNYIQARYNEIKAEAESYQTALATIRDRNQNMTTTRSQIEQERLQSKYSVANSIYSEMAKQLEQAKMQVKRDTPVLTIVQPVTVPRQPSNSRAKTLIVWAFLGGILGCGIVLGKGYLPKVKEMFAKSDKDAKNDTD